VTRYRNRDLQVRARDMLTLMEEQEHLVVRARRSSHVSRARVHGSH
jgi:hypothetical protein